MDKWEVTVTLKVAVDAGHGPGMAHETGKRIVQRAIAGLSTVKIDRVETRYVEDKRDDDGR